MKGKETLTAKDRRLIREDFRVEMKHAVDEALKRLRKELTKSVKTNSEKS